MVAAVTPTRGAEGALGGRGHGAKLALKRKRGECGSALDLKKAHQFNCCF
jgi:hypothetical protein